MDALRVTLPKTVSVVVVVEHQSRFLVIEEERGGPDGPIWYFPSGALEPGEGLATAARRETLEETGYEVLPERVIAINHGAFSEPAGLLWWRFVVAARLVSTDPARVIEDDIQSIDWLAPPELAARRLRSPDVVDLCRLYDSQRGLLLEDGCILSCDGTLEGFFA